MIKFAFLTHHLILIGKKKKVTGPVLSFISREGNYARRRPLFKSISKASVEIIKVWEKYITKQNKTWALQEMRAFHNDTFNVNQTGLIDKGVKDQWTVTTTGS